MKLLILFLICCYVSCGPINIVKDSDDEEEKTAVVDNTISKSELSKETEKVDKAEVVVIKGFASPAFEFSVENEVFRDSEHFFTTMIETLIAPKYPELVKDWKVELNGEYALNKFGSGDFVFLESGKDVFQTKTDTKGKFEIELDSRCREIKSPIISQL